MNGGVQWKTPLIRKQQDVRIKIQFQLPSAVEKKKKQVVLLIL